MFPYSQWHEKSWQSGLHFFRREDLYRGSCHQQTKWYSGKFWPRHLWRSLRPNNQASGICDDAWRCGIQWGKDATSVIQGRLQVDRRQWRRYLDYKSSSFDQKNRQRWKLRVSAGWFSSLKRSKTGSAKAWLSGSRIFGPYSRQVLFRWTTVCGRMLRANPAKIATTTLRSWKLLWTAHGPELERTMSVVFGRTPDHDRTVLLVPRVTALNKYVV